jgi:hypothetical protein
MGAMERLTIDLPADLVAAIRAPIQSGVFASESEVLEAIYARGIRMRVRNPTSRHFVRFWWKALPMLMQADLSTPMKCSSDYAGDTGRP